MTKPILTTMFTTTLFILASCFAAAQDPASKPAPRGLPQSEEELSERLDERLTVKIDENQTFDDLFHLLYEKVGIQAKIDPKGAGALGITTASPMVHEPVKLENIPLRTILRLILNEQDLTYLLDDEVLLITSIDEAKKYLKVKIYPVADLVTRKGTADMEPRDYLSNLMDLIQGMISPDSWDEGGEMIEYGDELLVIRQTDEIHAELVKFFADLRSKLAEIDKAAKPEAAK